jgi:Protein of unknown function (DUF2889)
MPLSTPAARERLHLRRVSYEGFRRTDGLFDIEAHITDHKDRDYKLAMGTRGKEIPVHNMWARVTINRHFDVVDIEAVTDDMPYPGQCSRIGPEYKKLIGSNLLKGFRKSIAEHMGGVKGCTHISELLGYLPTAAVQTFAGIKNEAEAIDGKKPFQLDSCHALATNTETVRVYYAKWYSGEVLNVRDEVAAL